MSRRAASSTRRGSALMETALFLPTLFLLLFGTIELARLVSTYFSLQKTLYTLARYVGTQQGVNFCDETDATVLAAKNFALTGTTDSGAEPLIRGLSVDSLVVRIERGDANTQEITECECSASGCDTAGGGRPPGYIVAYLTDGYPFRPLIPYLVVDELRLRPVVRVPFGGT